MLQAGLNLDFTKIPFQPLCGYYLLVTYLHVSVSSVGQGFCTFRFKLSTPVDFNNMLMMSQSGTKLKGILSFKANHFSLPLSPRALQIDVPPRAACSYGLPPPTERKLWWVFFNIMKWKPWDKTILISQSRGHTTRKGEGAWGRGKEGSKQKRNKMQRRQQGAGGKRTWKLGKVTEGKKRGRKGHIGILKASEK